MLPVPDPTLLFICRMCEQMAEQWDRGQTDCHQKCGGPKNGRLFPLYRGPLTPGYAESHCVVCGVDATKKMGITGERGEIGICDAHISVIAPEDKDA
jgi:hypothetical protein